MLEDEEKFHSFFRMNIEQFYRLSQLMAEEIRLVCTWGIGWQHILAQGDNLQLINVSKLLRRVTGLWVVCI
jgi:hypothetical protein